jgi:hypothetical protein
MRLNGVVHTAQDTILQPHNLDKCRGNGAKELSPKLKVPKLWKRTKENERRRRISVVVNNTVNK